MKERRLTVTRGHPNRRRTDPVQAILEDAADDRSHRAQITALNVRDCIPHFWAHRVEGMIDAMGLA